MTAPVLQFRLRMNQLECRQVQAQLTELLEQALSLEDAALIDSHLSACTHCRQVLAELQRTIALLGQLKHSPPPRHDPARKKS